MKIVRIAVLIFVFLMTTFTVTAQSEPLVFEGTEEDVIEEKINVAEYPIIQLESDCQNEYDTISITLYGSKDEEIVVFYNSCPSQGKIYYANNEIDQIEYVQVSSEGNWKISFLPMSAAYMDTYQAPVTVTGSGSSAFMIQNFDKILTYSFKAESYFDLTQYSSDGIKGYEGSKMLLFEMGPKEGKTIIDPNFSIFQVTSSGEWSLEFSAGKSAAAADDIIPEQPVEQVLPSVDHLQPDFLNVYFTKEMNSDPTVEKELEGIADSLGLLDEEVLIDWQLYTYNGKISIEKLMKEVQSFYQEEYADDGYLLLSEPVKLPLVILEEDLGDGYRILLEKEENKIWIYITNSNSEEEKHIFVFFCAPESV